MKLQAFIGVGKCRGKKHLPLHLPCDYQLMLRELFTDGLI